MKSILLSIIVSYRDRDIQSVKRFLDSILAQTYCHRKFELVFVNSGSRIEYSKELESLVADYSFCNYIYNETRGRPWNRSLALNSGIKKANGEYILTTDVDLIFSNNFLENLIPKLNYETKIHSQVYLLSEYFSDWKNLISRPTDFPLSPVVSLGLFILVHRDIIYKLKGFDEYYRYWGMEDIDFCKRAGSLGLRTVWLNTKSSPIYHQWHPHANYSKNYLMPNFWYEEINFYYAINKSNLVRNQTGWGHLYTKNDRPSLKYFEGSLEIKYVPLPNSYTQHAKGEFINKLINQFELLNSGEGLVIRYPANLGKPNLKLTLFEKFIFQKLRKKLHLSGFSIVPSIELGKSFRYFSPWPDIRDIFWMLIKDSHYQMDFYMDTMSPEHIFLIVKL